MSYTHPGNLIGQTLSYIVGIWLVRNSSFVRTVQVEQVIIEIDCFTKWLHIPNYFCDCLSRRDYSKSYKVIQKDDTD